MDKTIGVRNGRTGSEKCDVITGRKGRLQRTQHIFGKGARTNGSGQQVRLVFTEQQECSMLWAQERNM